MSRRLQVMTSDPSGPAKSGQSSREDRKVARRNWQIIEMTVVLALDPASVSGWAVGEPGGEPAHGSIRFASVGASHEAIFAAAYNWTHRNINTYEPTIIVWESPMPPQARRGASNINTTTLLFVLPAVIGCAAYLRGIYDCRKAYVKVIRGHFIGSNRKGAFATSIVVKK